MDAALLSAILQGGAMVILAYHFLVSLPRILERISKEQISMIQFFAEESAKDRNEFSRRAEMIAAELRRLTAERDCDQHIGGS